MNNKNNHLHYRYKAILSASNHKQKHKNKSSYILKDKIINANQTMLNYKSIRCLRTKTENEKYSSHKRMDIPVNANRSEWKEEINAEYLNQDLMQVTRVRMHKNSPDKLRVKTELTINRDELQQYLRKKRPTQFTISKSVEEIKKMFLKRVDVIINQRQLKITSTLANKQQTEIYQRPITTINNKIRCIRAGRRYQTKDVLGIESPFKTQTKETNFMTQYEEEVSGWEVKPSNEAFVQNKLIDNKLKPAKVHH